MARQSKKPRIPEYYRCRNPQCTRTSALLVEGYRAQQIPPNTPEERIHRVVESGVYDFTILCSCGHFTQVTPWRNESAGS